MYYIKYFVLAGIAYCYITMYLNVCSGCIVQTVVPVYVILRILAKLSICICCIFIFLLHY